jgi:putative tricarboxylic transport membrane protein
MLPTVAFGNPGSPDMAILLGAFVLHGLQPGPELLRSHLDLVYALLFGIGFSQFVTSGAGLIVTPFLARVSLLQSRSLAPFVLTLVFVGTYMLRSNIFDVAAAVLAGMFGFVMRRYGFPLVTIAIGFILGPLAERSFQQSMQMSDGSAAIFVTRPISAVLLALGLAALIFPAVPALRRALRTSHEI